MIVEPSYLVSAADGRYITGLIGDDQGSVKGLKLVSYLANCALKGISVTIVSTIKGSEARCVAFNGGRKDVRSGTACDEDLYN